jgi:hypothetical protein
MSDENKKRINIEDLMLRVSRWALHGERFVVGAELSPEEIKALLDKWLATDITELMDKVLPVHDEVLVDSALRERGDPIAKTMEGFKEAAKGFKIITDPEVLKGFYPSNARHEVMRHRSVDMAEPRYTPVERRRECIMLTDHFDLNMLRDDRCAIERNRISRGEARLFIGNKSRDLLVLCHDKASTSVLADFAKVPIEEVMKSPFIDGRSFLWRHLRGGDVVIYAEKRGGKVQFWRIDVLKPTYEQGSGKKAWSW